MYELMCLGLCLNEVFTCAMCMGVCGGICWPIQFKRTLGVF